MAQVSRGRRLMGEINVVPYIDVMLVLLIIFMITAPLLTQGVKVNLPKAHAEPLPANQAKDPVVLSVDAQGQLFLNIASDPHAALDSDAVLGQVTAALQAAPERAVIVKADKSVSYGVVMQAMVLLQRAGASKVGMATDPLPPPQSRAGS
ncbi:MAG: protein TolR [Gammaproteobacteria bacterium]|nr:protein TolR [Gammaproteobacteria bacterium]MDE2261831.1 protein TolR [Gammaproteobacteria bacterium]